MVRANVSEPCDRSGVTLPSAPGLTFGCPHSASSAHVAGGVAQSRSSPPHGLPGRPQVGGKSASLGEMISQMGDLGVPVPGGFSTTSHAYKEFLDKASSRSGAPFWAAHSPGREADFVFHSSALGVSTSIAGNSPSCLGHIPSSRGKGGINKFINDQLADESIYEDSRSRTASTLYSE